MPRTPLYQDRWFTFRFDDSRVIRRIHLEGIEPGRQMSIYRIDPRTVERLCHMAAVKVGEGGWVDLAEPIFVRAGEAFIAEPN
jgi:hypothetical protein